MQVGAQKALGEVIVRRGTVFDIDIFRSVYFVLFVELIKSLIIATSVLTPRSLSSFHLSDISWPVNGP